MLIYLSSICLESLSKNNAIRPGPVCEPIVWLA